MNKAEDYVDSGLALIQLGRWLQKHYAEVSRDGSQFDEDGILAKVLSKEPGIYVDIGASHPRECSNTWRLYQRGWRGLLIEPLMDTWGDILLQRPEDYLCPVAASNQTGFGKLRVARSVSSLRPDWQIGDVETTMIQVDKLSNILLHYPGINWMNTQFCTIDVEGHEREVLEGINWRTFWPKVLMIEYREYDSEKYGKDNSSSWCGILKKQGYEMHYHNKLNQIWTHS